jgi:hypothetical protein
MDSFLTASELFDEPLVPSLIFVSFRTSLACHITTLALVCKNRRFVVYRVELGQSIFSTIACTISILLEAKHEGAYISMPFGNPVSGGANIGIGLNGIFMNQ